VVPLFDKDNAPDEPPPAEPKQPKTKENDEARLERLRKKFHVDGENKFDKLAHSVTPLWRHPYKKQLMFKYQDVCKQLQCLGQKLRKVEVAFPADPKGLPCPVRPVLPSPSIEGYRNKDEFSQSARGPMVSPRQWASLWAVLLIWTVQVIPGVHSALPAAWLLREQLPGLLEAPGCAFQFCWAAYGHRHHASTAADTRGAVAREARPGGALCPWSWSGSAACRPSTSRPAATAGARMTRHPLSCFTASLTWRRRWGGVRFRISPESFFQVNSPVATYMYDAVRQLLRPTPQDTLLDVCCGTGTIGLTLASQLHSVFGMDVSAQAIEDANYNAQLNGISNAQYQVGRAEVLLPKIRHQFVAEELCAVVNPGRGGLNTRAVRALREYKQIKRLVYVSCKPEGAATDNVVELCDRRPKAHKVGPPFRLQLACPVDMFPQTRHCELLFLFVR
ncbi:hypothetical protein MTO96_049760, partial [Rhipicephalus appendiculatus]